MPPPPRTRTMRGHSPTRATAGDYACNISNSTAMRCTVHRRDTKTGSAKVGRTPSSCDCQRHEAQRTRRARVQMPQLQHHRRTGCRLASTHRQHLGARAAHHTHTQGTRSHSRQACRKPFVCATHTAACNIHKEAPAGDCATTPNHRHALHPVINMSFIP